MQHTFLVESYHRVLKQTVEQAAILVGLSFLSDSVHVYQLIQVSLKKLAAAQERILSHQTFWGKLFIVKLIAVL